MGRYSDVIAQTLAEDARQRARAAGVVAPKVDPDAMGRAMAVADARGLPPGVVADHLQDYDEQARLDALDRAAGESQALAHWLGNPDQAAVAKDDVGVLASIGGVFDRGLLSAARVMPGIPLPQSALDLREQQVAAVAEGPQMRAVQPSWFSELVGKFESGWHRGQQASALLLDPINPVRVDESVARGLGFGSAEAANTAALGVQMADLGRRAAGADVETAATSAQFAEIAAAEATGRTGEIVKAVALNPRAVMSVVAQSLGSTAPQLALSAAMPASRIVAATTAGGGSFTAEQGMTVLDVMADAGVDTADAGQVTAFLRDRRAMEAARRKATARGVAVASFDALTAGFAGRLLANSRRSIASIAGRVAGEGAVQAGGGAVGEAVAQVATEGRITSQSDILLEAAAEVPTFLAEGRGQIAEARRAARNNADRFDAAGEQRSISRVVELAAQSKTRQRAGSRFESLIQDMTAEGEDTVYLPAEAARTLFQDAADGAGPDLSALVDPDALREAFATGSEIAIPLAKYATLVTPEMHARVADVVRLQPGGRHDLPPVSPEEIQQAIADGLAEARASEERENGPAGQVFDDVYGQLLARQDEKLARQNASIVQSVYRNLSERVGTDAWALYQQFRINIPGARSDTRGQRRGVDLDIDPLLDALRTGQLPTDSDIFGDSLVTALHKAGGLRDSGGELANMDAAKARPGLVNNLAGMTLDDVLAWAYQEGFIAEAPTQFRETFDGDAPDINTFLDMLGRDLAAGDVYRADAMNPDRARFRESALSLREELDQRGIDLSRVSNREAREALGTTYNQPAAVELDFGGRDDAELDAEYDTLEGTDGGTRLDTDLVRRLSPEYRADPTLSPLIHRAASAYTKARFARMLARPVAGGRDAAVLFTAGGGGSGKSTATNVVIGPTNADIIYDGTLSNLERARADIEATLASGRSARIVYVYRSPANAAAGAIGRAIRTRRPVPVSVLAEAHAHAPVVVKALAQEYADDARVEIVAINNDGPMSEADRIPVAAIPEVQQDEAERTFREALEQARQAGELDERLYAAFDGRAPDARLGEGDRQRDATAREDGQANARNAVTQDPAAGGVSASGDTLFQAGRVRESADGTRTLERGGATFGERGGRWHLLDATGQPQDFATLDDARAAADTVQGEPQQDEPVDGAASWGVVLPDALAREALRASALHQQPEGAHEPRGSVTFRRDAQGRVFDIELLAGMDASTFMHEMGHVYLEVLNDLAAREGAPQQVTDDMATLNAWLGREAGAAFTTEQHEQFARGFEAYLREGKAPSSALRRAFASFKVWLTAIYRSARGLNVELTDDVRAVMDRLVASDAEIADARSEQYQEALITDAVAVGMSPAEFAAYNAAVQRAREDAEAAVAAEVLGALQREQKAWFNQEKRRVAAEVAAELREQPIYRAIRLLRTGKLPNGEEAPDVLRIKLAKDDLLDRYGQSFLRNLTGMYAVEGGVRADEAAAVLGFRSGSDLVEGLVNAPKLSEAVAAETDARMATRYPDPMTDGTLPDRAMVAAHRDRQADVMVREIRALETHVSGRAQAQGAVIKGLARSIIAEKPLRALQPATYRAAEARAGREAFEAAAKQDWPAALAARRRQLLNFELFREAVRARDEAAAASRYLAKFTKDKVRARLGKAGADYLDQVDALLDRFDFRKISDKAADRRASLAAWIKAQAERGIDVNLPQKLLDEAFRIPYRQMTMADLRALRDAVKAIDHLARLKGKLLLAGEVRDAAEVDDAMAASLRAAHAERPTTTGDRPRSAQIRQAFQQGRVLQGAATDIARELDGFKDGGAIWRNTVGVIRDAINNRVNPKLLEAQNALAEIYVKHYDKDEIRSFNDTAPMPEAGGDLWSKGRLLSLALNWGNEGNREAILTQARARLTAEQAGALLGRLDARDWAFVQDVWGLIDAQWPEIAEAQRRRTGLVPERVQPSPFTVTTSDGRTLSIPGGYYPLKYEADSVKSMKDEADDFYNSIRTGRTAKAATRNGHTVERVGSGGRTVRLDTGVIQQHLRDVIRDVHLGDAVNYVQNVLNGQQFREALDATGMQEYRQSLEVWLKDAAAGEIGPRVWHERAMRSARQNFTASVLTFKLASALLQVTGLVQSSVVLGQANLWNGVQQFLRRPIAMTRYVRQASPYMDSRMRTHIEAVQAVMDAEAGRFEAGKAAAIRWGYWMIGRVQALVDTATWLAAENKGMRVFGGDVAKARQYADDAVSRAQGSSEFIDKSPLQRGTLGDNVRQTEWVKATTTLMGYMIAKGNAAYEVTRKTNFRSPRQAMKWMANMAMLYSVEGLIVAAIRGGLPSDEEDDGLLDDLGEFALKDTLGTFFGTIPGAATMVDEFRGYDSGGVLANAWGAYAKAVQQAQQGELDRAAVKSAVTVAGVTFGIPSGQINKTIDALAARRDGTDVSPYEYLTGPKKE